MLQVEATKGALWDAYAETAIYMEITQVQVLKGAPAQGEIPSTVRVSLAQQAVWFCLLRCRISWFLLRMSEAACCEDVHMRCL